MQKRREKRRRREEEEVAPEEPLQQVGAGATASAAVTKELELRQPTLPLPYRKSTSCWHPSSSLPLGELRRCLPCLARPAFAPLISLPDRPLSCHLCHQFGLHDAIPCRCRRRRPKLSCPHRDAGIPGHRVCSRTCHGRGLSRDRTRAARLYHSLAACRRFAPAASPAARNALVCITLCRNIVGVVTTHPPL